MGVQLPRSPVRLSLFRCPALSLPSVRLLCFVVRLSCSPLYGFFVSLSDSLAWLVLSSFSRARTIHILPLFYMGDKSGRVASLISWRKPFPHPTPFFGFNTSCFWRRNVLSLYRDMGGASASPFFRHFPFKIGDLGAHPGKICLLLILISLLLISLRCAPK